MSAVVSHRINLWSGPRNVSTALMYSFAQRPDTRALDEPLYGHFLRVSARPDPDCQKIIAGMESDAGAVVSRVILGPCDRPVLFMKQMAHHLVDMDWGFIAQCTNVLLVRDPQAVLTSLSVVVPHPTLADTGLATQTKLLRYLRDRGQSPPVLDAGRLVGDPEAVLRRLCQALSLPFMPAMLSWKAGPHPEDGLWAKHWYANAHRSTGFEPMPSSGRQMPDELRPLLEECTGHYEELASLAL